MVGRTLLLASIAAIPMAHAAPDVAAVENEITRLEQTWGAAYGANDLPRYFSFYAADPVLVFYNKRTTLAEYRKLWTEAVKTEPVQSAHLSDLKVIVDPQGDAAIASYQLDFDTRKADGSTAPEHGLETDTDPCHPLLCSSRQVSRSTTTFVATIYRGYTPF